MEIGISIPRLPDAAGIRHFVQRAEELGFQSALAGDHIVLPTGGTDQYPYTADGSFQRPADEPFLETMTLLGYLAACTESIKLGSTVIILPAGSPDMTTPSCRSRSYLLPHPQGTVSPPLEYEAGVVCYSTPPRTPRTLEHRLL